MKPSLTHPAILAEGQTKSAPHDQNGDRRDGTDWLLEPSLAEPAAPPPPVKILLVDDQEPNLRLLQAVLADLGQPLVCARSGEEALRRLLEEEFALVLLDVAMPGLDGIEVARRLREQAAAHLTPVIFITGHAGDTDFVVRGYEAGGVDYLIKPVRPEVLRAKVKVFLQLARARQHLKREIIERRRAEAALQELNAGLEQRVAVRTADLRAANQALGEARLASLNVMQEAIDARQLVEQTNAALRESEERVTALLDSAAEGFLGLDASGGCTFINRSALRLLGYERPEELLGRQLHPLIHHHRPDGTEYPAEQCKVLRSIQHEIGCHEDGELFWRKDGSCFPVEYWSYPVQRAGRTAGTVVTFVDIAERKRGEERLRASLREKETLLREVHHRVKNNLQVISSLVSLQADGLADAGLQALFQEVCHRVRSMALVHEKLYQSVDLARVNFGDYARELMDYLVRSHGTAARVTWRIEADPVPLDIEKATPCGLILNELATNALKHAFRGRDRGEIAVELRHGSDGEVRLRLADDGVGLPPGLDWRRAGSLGLRLVQLLAGQLNGKVETGVGPGTEFRVSFPAEKNQTE
ncbi:MAG: response regulator [Verrucomicrobia bacterium]|nr:response regulator [Verrucomicrobiota bacterium]